MTASDDIYELYTTRELTIDGVREALPGLTVEGNDGDGTHLRIRDGRRPVLELEENSLDVQLDFVDYVKDISGYADLPFCYRLRWPSGWRRGAQARRRALPVAETLARWNDGVVALFFERVVWPVRSLPVPDFDPDLYEDDEDDKEIQAVKMRAYVRESVNPDPAAAWMRAVSRVAPQWSPTEYTGRARMLPLDESTIEAADDRRYVDDVGVFLVGPAPIDAVELLAREETDPHGMYLVEWAVDPATLSTSELDLLYELLLEVCDELGAELAWAEVLDGWTYSYAGDVIPVYLTAEQPQSLVSGGVVLSGLPSVPVPWCYLGPAYTRLLSDVLLRRTADWEQRPTARGTGLRLSRTPVKSEELAPTWFPAEYCMSVSSGMETGATIVPTWS
ncbi:hypothetical protein [Actinomyces viscosus]|uniref:hypothetical protein n=1 Tax=Actinomyces viscosus TaxID=1656 RepID=UPI0028F11650|nr:hypothetical protein [Actinomyces viscosus]